MHLVRLELRAIKLEWNLAIKRPRYYVSPETQVIVRCKKAALYCSEKFKYLGVLVTSDGRRNKETDTWIGKTKALVDELYVT